MRTEPNAVIIALSLALIAPQGASAQIASRVEAGALVTSRDGDVPASTMRVAPGLRLALPLVDISANGSAWLQGQQWEIADGTISATVYTPTLFGMRGEILANASRAFFDRSIANDQIDAQLRLHYLLKQRGGIWFGGGMARPWRIAVVSHVDVATGGAWTRVGGATVSGTYTNFYLTKVAPASDSTNASVSCTPDRQAPLPPADAPSGGLDVAPPPPPATSTECHRYSSFSDIEGSLHWEHGFFEIAAQSGYRFGSSDDVAADSRRWAAATATIWLSNSIAAIMGGGRIPANPSRGLPARNYANMGIMLSYSAVPRNAVPVASRVTVVRDFEVKTTSAGMQRILLRVGGVESVEIMGDFSDWGSLQMIRRGRDLWELVLPLSSGVHQINLRVDDGPWFAPPGMPVMRDGFNGEVGILVVS